MSEERSLKTRVLRGLLAFAIIFAGLVVTIILAMTKERPPQLPNEDPVLLVEVLEVRPETVQFEVTSQGNVTPRTQTTLVAQVSGLIVEVSPNFVPGGFFEANEVLLRIDPSDYQVAVKRAEAELAGREAQLASEVARAEQAAKDWRSVGKGQASDLVLRRPQLAEARAAVAASEADLERARRDLERTEIFLPYTGLVKSKSVDIGQFVNSGGQLGSSFAIDYAEIRLPLTDSDIAFLDLPNAAQQSKKGFLGPQVTLVADVGDRRLSWSAHIVRTEGVIDPKNRVLYAVARVADPYNLSTSADGEPLKIGQYVKATISGLRVDNLTRLPRHALRGENMLLIADTDNTLQRRTVEVVRADARHVYVASGLKPGDRVILTAVEAPIDGTAIRTPDMAVASGADDNTEEMLAQANDQATPEDKPEEQQ